MIPTNPAALSAEKFKTSCAIGDIIDRSAIPQAILTKNICHNALNYQVEYTSVGGKESPLSLYSGESKYKEEIIIIIE